MNIKTAEGLTSSEKSIAYHYKSYIVVYNKIISYTVCIIYLHCIMFHLVCSQRTVYCVSL